MERAIYKEAIQKVFKLSDALSDCGYEGSALQAYVARLVFCFIANDTGIFPQNAFKQYLFQSNPDASDLSERLSRLFDVLNTPEGERSKGAPLPDELKLLCYVNNETFKAKLPVADFNTKTRAVFMDCAYFDWRYVSPTIFGIICQRLTDKKRRRELGMDYTEEDNILKVINPLFLDELWEEFHRVKTDPAALDRFHDKIANLKFLDPACGSGNFLIVTYIKLRELELEIIKIKVNNMKAMQSRNE